MRAYAALLRLRCLLLLQYRVAAFAGICTQVFFGLVRVMIFDGFFRSSSLAQPMSFAHTVTYIWLGQALLGMLPWNGDREVQDLIRTGNVSYELCRPVNLNGLWLSRCVALRSAPTALRAVPVILTASLLMPPEYRLAPPASAAAALAWALTTAGAVLLAAAITNLYSIALLWTISGEGIARLVPPFVALLGGMLIPLSFFPDWMQPLLRWLPFSGLMDVPFRLYLGQLGPGDLAGALAHQLGWAFGLALLGQWLISRGLKRVVVQGG
ncbi:MAG: ABC-2 family transporter protein [Bacillota bacterium]|nr:ABC-2 family transporter protein [Bacillota bacterium]